MGTNCFSVFTKPWKKESLDELGDLVRSMGFDAVEYPLRDGFQVQPAEGTQGIVKLAKTLEKHGVKVASLAAGIDNETAFAGCGEAGIPIIRICQSFNRDLGFHENMDALRRKYDGVLPFCRKYGVTLGVQMHHGSADITCSWDSYLLLKDYDPKYVAAVWDAGHSGLAGESPRYGLDCLWDHLCMVNFKAAYWFRKNPEALANDAQWGVHWVSGRNGMSSWKEAVDYLKKRGYKGTVCLPAEYSDEPNVEKYAREDLKYIKGLFGG
ncbi:MAG: sugar phosphate isomerase/epimerase [Treponema sp.]|nr:sugar phosphate isomerase/epimerase [Treponema sp.]